MGFFNISGSITNYDIEIKLSKGTDKIKDGHFLPCLWNRIFLSLKYTQDNKVDRLFDRSCLECMYKFIQIFAHGILVHRKLQLNLESKG